MNRPLFQLLTGFGTNHAIARVQVRDEAELLTVLEQHRDEIRLEQASLSPANEEALELLLRLSVRRPA